MSQKRPFRVYSRGNVLFFATPMALGRWLLSDGLALDHITLSYSRIGKSSTSPLWANTGYQGSSRRFRYSPYSPAMRASSLRFEDDELRVEAPNGEVLPSQTLLDCVRAHENECRARKGVWYSSYRGYKCNRHRGTHYRIIHTQNERRGNGDAGIDGAPSPRPSRRNLPTYYDEVYRLNERNWKSFRKTAWKQDALSPRAVFRYSASLQVDPAT